jgi:hypothetical protein
VLLLAMLVMCTSVSASSAARPDWYPQLKLAVDDAGDAGAAIGTCTIPQAAKPTAGHLCAAVDASNDSVVLNRVSTYTEMGKVVGPCRRLLFTLDHTTTAAAARALVFATAQKTTMAKDVSGRRTLEQAATQVTSEFHALQHCLGIGKS